MKTPPMDLDPLSGGSQPSRVPRNDADDPGQERLPSADSAFVRAVERATPGVPWGAREQLRRTLRWYGQLVGSATAQLRALPDFLIIGAKRSGTTMLLRYLHQHPLILPPFPARQAIKGVRYFDHNHARGESWYRRHFVTRQKLDRRGRRHGGRAITGEASPYYLYHPLVADRVAAELPRARLIVMLREPLARAHSHYKKNVELFGIEPLSFEDALLAEDERLDGEVDRLRSDPGYISFAHEHHAYALQSDYAAHLKPWLDRFPREQILICRTEDLRRDPQMVLDRVTGFLGLPGLAALPAPRPLNVTSASVMSEAAADLLRARLGSMMDDLSALLQEDVRW